MQKPYTKSKAARALIILALAVALTGCAAFKTTDPANPNFNAENFRFEDYTKSDPTPEFQKLFPVGTPKSYVDHVLIDVGGAKSNKIAWTHIRSSFDAEWRKVKPGNAYGYQYINTKSAFPFGWAWGVSITYDKKDKLKSIVASGGALSPL